MILNVGGCITKEKRNNMNSTKKVATILIALCLQLQALALPTGHKTVEPSSDAFAETGVDELKLLNIAKNSDQMESSVSVDVDKRAKDRFLGRQNDENSTYIDGFPIDKFEKAVDKTLRTNKDFMEQKDSLKSVKLSVNEKNYVTYIDFDYILEKAKTHSYDLKIADYQVLIAKQEIRGARSEYFPKLIATAGTEYTKNFRDIKESTVMSIGESFINPYTRYQSVMGVTLQYNLFDFGLRRGALDMAKEEVFIKELQAEEQLQELNLTLIDTYAKVLMTQKQIELNKEILGIARVNLEYKQRLFDAKEISKTELNDEEVRVCELEKRISELKQMQAESLNWLEFYTGDSYDVDHLTVEDIPRPYFDIMITNDYTKSVIWQMYDKQLKKKEIELQTAKRANYPKINAYGRYYVYGSDHDDYGKSLENVEPSNFTVGASANMMLFDGMKNRANIQKIALEYKQLQVERDKAIAQLMIRMATMRSNLIYLDEQIQGNHKIIKELADKENSVKRLVAKRVASPIEENEARIKLLEEQIELVKNSVTSVAIIRGIQVLTTN